MAEAQAVVLLILSGFSASFCFLKENLVFLLLWLQSFVLSCISIISYIHGDTCQVKTSVPPMVMGALLYLTHTEKTFHRLAWESVNLLLAVSVIYVVVIKCCQCHGTRKSCLCEHFVLEDNAVTTSCMSQ